jgi:VWFA-related protein
MRVHALLAAALLLLGAGQPGQSQQPQQPAPPQQAPPQQPPQQQPPQQQQGQQRPPVIRSGINFVSVDVIVTDKKTGDVVLDMKQDDFEVREDKKPQAIQTFNLVKIDPLEAPATPPREITSPDIEEAAAREPNTRLFILFLDDYHVRRGSDLAVRPPLIDFVQNQLAPQDMVAVMYPLTPVSALTFTRNRSSLISSINNFLGRKGDYLPRNPFEEKYAYYPAVQVEQIRNDVTVTALEGAAIKLGGMREGRKSIILVSEGFTANLPVQLADPIAALPGVGNTSQPGRDPAYDPRAEAQKFFNDTDLNSRLRDVFDTCNRNNTSIYAVDPRGLATNEYDINQGVSLQTDRQNLNSTIDTLYTLANNTDGRAIVNRNDLAAGMKQIMRDASGYYLLGYTSATAPTDGKYHVIDVHTKRPGVEVRFRKGYWAYTPEEAARAREPGGGHAGPPPAISNALSNVVESTKTGHAARFWTGTDRGPDGKTRLTFTWEPIVAGDSARASEVPAHVMVTAVAADGHPLYRGRVPDPANPSVPDLAPGPGQAASSTPSAASPGGATVSPPVGGTVSFSAAPGAVELKLSVENEHGQVIDATTESLTVPDYGRTGVSLSTPKVYRARTAREMMLLRNNLDAPPVAMREFNRAERLLIRVDAYAPDGGKPEVTAKLLNRDGHPMADVPVQAVDGKPFQIDLPLASLAPGEYVVELDAKAPSGTAQQMIGFKIGT